MPALVKAWVDGAHVVVRLKAASVGMGAHTDRGNRRG